MRELVKSLKRLLTTKKIELKKIDSLYFVGKITKDEYDFIVK